MWSGRDKRPRVRALGDLHAREPSPADSLARSSIYSTRWVYHLRISVYVLEQCFRSYSIVVLATCEWPHSELPAPNTHWTCTSHFIRRVFLASSYFLILRSFGYIFSCHWVCTLILLRSQIFRTLKEDLQSIVLEHSPLFVFRYIK